MKRKKWWSFLGMRIMLLLVAYGRFGAGLPSVHGGFEPSVPNRLRETKK